ncbi:unnamed protein product [Nezara viridula]|uniref:Uncharacterized protein n=1 Tax=Nezara viridula TaxID=85310 RepID=A0A9P0H0Y7_NEZVI|nr:unnamed protein product [Nezara viridula]
MDGFVALDVCTTLNCRSVGRSDSRLPTLPRCLTTMLIVFLVVCSSTMGAPLQNFDQEILGTDWFAMKENDVNQHPFTVPKPISMKLVAVRKPRYTSFMDMLSDKLGPEAPQTIKLIFRKNVLYPVEKVVPVAMKEYVDVPRPYHVPVLIERKVPFLVERKVPVKVEVPVEKPYPVEVAVPYEVTVVKKIPFVVEKKVPYTVQVPEYVGVPVPIEEDGGKSVKALDSFDQKIAKTELEKSD